MTAPLFYQNQGQQDVLSLLQNQAQVEQYKSKSFNRTEFIYLPNQRADHLYIIKSGRVKIGTHGDDGREIIKKIAVKGEIFGDMNLFGQTNRKDYAITMEATEVIVLSTFEFNQLLSSNKALSYLILQNIGRQLIEVEQRLEAVVFKNSRGRVILFLESLAKKRGQRVGYEMLVRNFFTHQEIANLTATSRQTVTMVLNELRNKNILTFNRRRLLIRDMDLLRAEAA